MIPEKVLIMPSSITFSLLLKRRRPRDEKLGKRSGDGLLSLDAEMTSHVQEERGEEN